MSIDTENLRYNITMWQGSTFDLSVNVKSANNANIDLTGYSASMQIREAYDSANATASLTSSNNEISFDSANGIVTLELAASRTANITVDLSGSSRPPKNIYVYDLELTDANNKTTKLLYGDVVVYGEVTR